MADKTAVGDIWETPAGNRLRVTKITPSGVVATHVGPNGYGGATDVGWARLGEWHCLSRTTNQEDR